MGPGGVPGPQAAPRVWVVPVGSLASAPGVVWDSGLRREGARCRQRGGGPGPAPTTVALGWVPVSGLKSAPPARACPGPWQPAAGKHGKVGRASRAHKEPLVAGGGVREGRVPRSGRAGAGGTRRPSTWGLRPGPGRVCVPDGTARLLPSGFGSRFHPLSGPGGLPSPVGASVSSSVRWGLEGITRTWGDVRGPAGSWSAAGLTSQPHAACLCDLGQVTSRSLGFPI